MSRQLELAREQREEKRRIGILEAVEGGLEAAVSHAGGQFTGMAVKGGEGDCMLVIKAVMPAGPCVAFVGASDLGSALMKAVREARRDKLRWRADQYAGPE